MFQGHTLVSLDAKSRIVIPSKFRKYMNPEAQNKLVLTRGMDKSILVYPLNEWERVKEGYSNFNVFNSLQRYFMRQFMMYVNEVELDSQNRILLPSQLIEFANIKKEVILLGIGHNFEIWDPETKRKYDSTQEDSYEQVAQKVSDIIFNKNSTV